MLATYNRARKLEMCLESIFNQKLPSEQYEVIVVDDGSSDGTPQLLERFQKRCSNLSFRCQSNRGAAAARNLGVKHARAGVVAFTDDDCLVPSNWLERMLDGFARYPQVAVVGGYQEASEATLAQSAVARFERFQTREDYNAKEEEVVGGMETPAVVTNNMAIKKEVFWQVGGFDESFPGAAGEDADLKKRIADANYQLLYLPLKVTHQQDYNFKGFVRQSFGRGIGSRHFQRKWGVDVSNKRLFLFLVQRPFGCFLRVYKRSGDWVMGALAFLQQAAALWGQFNYDRLVEQK